jgi:hypothetical protein
VKVGGNLRQDRILRQGGGGLVAARSGEGLPEGDREP